MISVQNLTKYYQNKLVLNDISFEVATGECITLIGRSGSGKSTILRCINGLEKIDSGKIKIENATKTEIATVFQNFNLFANMTVMQNICYAPIVTKRFTAAEALDHGIIALKRVGMDRYAKTYPHNLSGGQKQRVAIARSLCIKPKIMMFDEPTSALDPENVKEVSDMIKSLADHSITILLVTHEIKLAAKTADRVLFLENGSIIENTKTKQFFTKPKSLQAQDFLSCLDL